MRRARFVCHLAGLLILAGNHAHADPVVPNLLAYWDFNQSSGNTLPDLLGNYHGTLAGSWPEDGSGWVAGKSGLGNALSFDGGWVNMGVLPQDNPMNVSGALTVAAWIKPDSLGGSNAGRIFNHRSASQSSGYEVYLRGDGQLAFHYGSGTFIGSATGAVEVGPDAPWQHAAVTLSEVYQVQLGEDWVDRTRLSFYVNGNIVSSNVISPPVPVLTNPTLLLGSSTTHSSRGFDGLMDDVGVWGHALTGAHVATLHSVVQHRKINYDLGQTQQLFDIHAAGEGSVTLDGRQWTYATGLSTDPADLGRVVGVDGRYTISLDSTGAGITTPNSLIAYWRFDEESGSITVDSSASGLDGTLQGTDGNTPTRIDGKFGSALSFHFANQEHVEIGSDNIVTNLSGEKSFAFWVRLDSREGGDNASPFLGIDDGTADSRWFIDDNNMEGGIRISGSGITGGFTVGSGALDYDEDTWQHVVVTDDGSGSGGSRVYVDGQLVGTGGSFDYTGLTPESVLRLGMGRHSGGYRYMHGGLDDFGVWNAALTEPQVKALFSLANHPDINHDLGQVQALFDTYDAGLGGSVRHGSLQWESVAGLRTDVAAVGEVFKSDGRYMVALDSSGTGLAANAELIGHWTFDEASGASAYDSAGTNDGMLQGTDDNLPTWIEGKFGSALGFDGQYAQQVEVGADNVITALSGAKTFSFWTRLQDNEPSSNGFLGIDNDTSGNRWYVDDHNSGGDLRVSQDGGGPSEELFIIENVLNYNCTQWQHVLLADDGTGPGGARVYVDGQLVATVDSFDYSGLLPGSVLRFGVARHIDGYRWLKGDLDDVGVWRVALTDPQAKALYNVAEHAELGYDLGKVQKLFNAHHDGAGTRVDGRYWVHAAGLNADTEALGQVVQDGQEFCLPLAGDGTGVWAPGKLIAHWTFDDGTGSTVADAMGNVHGVLQGSDGTDAWIADGRLGGALRLDSSQGQYVLAGSDNVVTNMPGEKTIAFWVRMDETDGSGRSNGFISIDRDGSDRWYLDTGTGTDTNDVRAFRADGGSGADVFRVSGVLEYGDWQHVVVTDDGSGSGGVRVFVNGEIAGTRDSFEFSDLLPTTTLRLGAARHAGVLQYLNGDLDDFGIWSVALTGPQVAGLYQFATAKTLGYDLGMLQQLFDHHERGPGGGELVLDGDWRWQYTDGLDTGEGLLVWKDGNYYFQLDAAGTGLMAIPEPGTLALLGFGLIAALLRRRRNGQERASVHQGG